MISNQIKQLVYNHLSNDGSLSQLADSYPVESDRKLIREYGNILKDTYRTLDEYVSFINTTYGSSHSVDMHPELSQALDALNNNDSESYKNEIWKSVKPYDGVKG
jgi:FPC/CPF motif-containing protein YcgG